MQRLAAFAAVLLAATACGGSAPPADEPDLVGVVVRHDERNGFLVRYGPDTRVECSLSWVAPVAGSRVLRRTALEDYEEAAWSDVAVGRTVEAWQHAEIPSLLPCPGIFAPGTVVVTAE